MKRKSHPLYILSNENVDQPSRTTNKKNILPSLYGSPPDNSFCSGKNTNPTIKFTDPDNIKSNKFIAFYLGSGKRLAI